MIAIIAIMLGVLSGNSRMYGNLFWKYVGYTAIVILAVISIIVIIHGIRKDFKSPAGEESDRLDAILNNVITFTFLRPIIFGFVFWFVDRAVAIITIARFQGGSPTYGDLPVILVTFVVAACLVIFPIGRYFHQKSKATLLNKIENLEFDIQNFQEKNENLEMRLNSALEHLEARMNGLMESEANNFQNLTAISKNQEVFIDDHQKLFDWSDNHERRISSLEENKA